MTPKDVILFTSENRVRTKKATIGVSYFTMEERQLLDLIRTSPNDLTVVFNSDEHMARGKFDVAHTI